MKKLLLLTPIILSLTSCNSSQLQSKFEKAYLSSAYGNNGTILQIEKLRECDYISVWFVMSETKLYEKSKYITTGEYTFNAQDEHIQNAWVVYEVVDL